MSGGSEAFGRRNLSGARAASKRSSRALAEARQAALVPRSIHGLYPPLGSSTRIPLVIRQRCRTRPPSSGSGCSVSTAAGIPAVAPRVPPRLRGEYPRRRDPMRGAEHVGAAVLELLRAQPVSAAACPQLYRTGRTGKPGAARSSSSNGGDPTATGMCSCRWMRSTSSHRAIPTLPAWRVVEGSPGIRRRRHRIRTWRTGTRRHRDAAAPLGARPRWRRGSEQSKQSGLDVRSQYGWTRSDFLAAPRQHRSPVGSLATEPANAYSTRRRRTGSRVPGTPANGCFRCRCPTARAGTTRLAKWRCLATLTYEYVSRRRPSPRRRRSNGCRATDHGRRHRALPHPMRSKEERPCRAKRTSSSSAPIRRR